MNKTFAFVVGIVWALGCGESGTTGNDGNGGSGGAGVTTSSGAGGTTNSGTGGTTSSGTGGTTSSGTGGMGGGPSACVPSGTSAFAMSKILLGDTDPDGTSNKLGGWKQYGFDLDGKVSTPSSTDLCKPSLGGSTSAAYPDGNNGIDNSFGKNVLPILMGVFSTSTADVNQMILGGDSTLALKFPCTEPTQAPHIAKVYDQSPLGAQPKFDGTDSWPVDPASLSNASNIESAVTVFPQTLFSGMSFGSGSINTTIEFELRFGGKPFYLKIHHARMSMDFDPSFESAGAGQLGGVLDVAEFQDEFKRFARTFDPSFCLVPTIDSILTQIAQASDILKDGTQDPSKTCDGISIGIGFEMKAIQLGGIGPASPPLVDPCTP